MESQKKTQKYIAPVVIFFAYRWQYYKPTYAGLSSLHLNKLVFKKRIHHTTLTLTVAGATKIITGLGCVCFFVL